MLKLLLGGSPCTYWSIAQSKHRETEPSGLGWELFKNYLIAKDKYNPDYFLYENNYSMDKKIRDEITKQLGVEPIMINSALVSAQSRKRLYWTNIPNVKQPDDKGIMLNDILESGKNLSSEMKSYCLTASYNGACGWNTLERKQRTMIAEPVCVQEQLHNRCADCNGNYERRYEVRTDKKSGTITTTNRQIAIAQPVNDSKQYRVYSPFGKSTTLCAEGGGLGAKSGIYATPLNCSENPNSLKIYEVRNGNITINDKTYPIKLADGFYIIRLLTVLECKRLQTVPDNYIMPCSKSQNYKMLGNGWTIDVIAHILSHIPNLKNKNIEVLSMYDGMSCGHIALEKLGCNVINYYATEIDKYAIKTVFANYPDTIYLGDAFNVRKDDFKIKPPKIDKQEISAVSGSQLTLF